MKLDNQDIECKVVILRSLIPRDMYNRVNRHIDMLSTLYVTKNTFDKQHYEVANQVNTNTFLNFAKDILATM